MTVLNFPSPNDKDWKLLEEVSWNDRTIIVWYNSDQKMISLVMFNLTDQPNELSKKAPYSNWGFLTHYVSQMYSEKEAASVVSLYLKDMESENYWWELIN
jgi:hypothetical protein